MGSVISSCVCPNCKSEDAYNELYYKSGEEYTLCPECGYSYSHELKRDENGVVKKDSEKGYEFDNMIWEHDELKNPYGCLIIYCEKCSQIVPLDSKEHLDSILDEIKEQNSDVVTDMTLNQFVNGVKKSSEIKVTKNGLEWINNK